MRGAHQWRREPGHHITDSTGTGAGGWVCPGGDREGLFLFSFCFFFFLAAADFSVHNRSLDLSYSILVQKFALWE